MLPKVPDKLLAIFRFLPEPYPCPQKNYLRNYIYYALNIFIFVKKFEITIFAEILNIMAKFWKDSVFRAEIFAKFSRNIDEIFGAAILVVTRDTILGIYFSVLY